MVLLVSLLIALGVALMLVLIWAAMTVADEAQQRQRRVERDLDMRREDR